MKEKEFIKEYKEDRNLKSLRVSKEKIEAFWETLSDVLKEEGKLTFKGWGSFRVKKMKERVFNNPKTKKIERILECKKIIFRQGQLLKKRFNRQEK
ncbi:HU family DNA-binding protein [Fusobacterium sp. THCT13E1]